MGAPKACPECGRVTLRLSWSALQTHETCSERSWLRRQGRKAKIENTRNFFPGTVVDRVVRQWLTTDPTPGLMPDMVEPIIEREYTRIAESENETMVWRDGGDKAKVIADCREAVTKIEPALNRLVVPFEYQADLGFKAPIKIPHPGGGTEEVLLIGYMDIIVKDDQGRWFVWDVKMTRDNSYWRKTLGQLVFYDLATLLMFQAPTARVGLLQPLCTERVKPFEVTENERRQMLARITAFARDIWTDTHAPRSDSAECGWCVVRHACSKFEPVQVNGQRRVRF